VSGVANVRAARSISEASIGSFARRARCAQVARIGNTLTARLSQLPRSRRVAKGRQRVASPLGPMSEVRHRPSSTPKGARLLHAAVRSSIAVASPDVSKAASVEGAPLTFELQVPQCVIDGGEDRRHASSVSPGSLRSARRRPRAAARARGWGSSTSSVHTASRRAGESASTSHWSGRGPAPRRC